MTLTDTARPRANTAWAIYLAAISALVGFMVYRAGEVLRRDFPGTFVALVVLLACCAVLVEALWNGRRWLMWAVGAACVASLYVLLSRSADAPVRYLGPPFPTGLGWVLPLLIGAPFVLLGHLLADRSE